jgi:monoamine oxidase
MPLNSPSQMPQLEADVVVVGAGYAGLTAALRLTQAKPSASVIVLEARELIGGRVRTVTLPDGTWLDLGGTWFGPGQDYSYGLAREMGVDTYPTYNEGDSLLVLPDGTIVRKPESFPLADLFPAAADLLVLEEIESMYQQIPVDAPWDAPHAREWDRQTFAAWVESRLDDDSLALARAALNTIMAGLFDIDPAELSLLDALYLLRSHGGLLKLMSVQGGDQQDRVKGGAQTIANRIAAQLGDAIHLSSPVRQITQDDTGVEVVSDTVTVRAQRVILAVPPGLAGHLRYDPPLPADRTQLLQRVPVGSVLKVLTMYDEPFWRNEGLTGQSFAVTDAVGATFDGSTDTGKPGLMIAFAFGPHARALDRLSEDERRRTILDSLAKRFGPRAGAPTLYHELEWAKEVWSGGGIFAHFPTGVLTNYGSLLREPVGRIHWAGTETSSAFHGSINGAIESGERAAREVLRATRGTEV